MRTRIWIGTLAAAATVGACATSGGGAPDVAGETRDDAEGIGPGDGDEVAPCIPTGPETCDGADNDCDTLADEDFDLENDIGNCGACGVVCGALPNADAVCDGHACVVGACHAGYVDADASPTNGCEYACTATSAESEADGTCNDAVDNDCDGRTDGEDPDCAPCVREFCDDLDNDCDGLTDEDFDLDFDAVNCGACRVVCGLHPNAVPICVLGECSIRCEAGWEDRDGLVANGCEATCAPGGDLGETECNGVDNDCDGETDEGYVAYECGYGPCMRSSVCHRGTETCRPRLAPSLTDTTCDGVDDDCDGSIDDDVDCRCTTDTDCDDANSCTIDTCGPDNICRIAPIADDTPCPAGICCGGACVDPATDPGHCGSCGGICGPGSGCSAGSCACTGSALNCDGRWDNGCESDPMSDPANCGACGNSCGARSTCSRGTCACAPPYLNCNGTWSDGCEVDPSRDPIHCGACGNSCGPNATCSGGTCACTAPYLNCDGTWVTGCESDPMNDPANCGRCGNSCGPNAACSGGSCRCVGAYLDCNGTWTDGCETDRTSDPNNCGACGMRCGSNASCSGSSCVCDSTWGNCDGSWGNGCERSLRSLSDCGACGRSCSPANATGPSCSTGTCGFSGCVFGWGDCDGRTDNGCETPLTTLSNCGACGRACNPANATGASCGTGTCTFSGCTSGWGNCDGRTDNGCETSLRTLSNCGACGVSCDLPNASESCSTGTCSIGSCNSGWGDCNGNPVDGCETNLSLPTSCGTSCGTVTNCTALSHVSAAGCSSGSCNITGCDNAYSECNNIVSDGCERLLDDNVGSCGINYMGSIAGDAGTGMLTRSSYGENWYYFELREDDSSLLFPYISATVVLDVPPEVDYDLYIRCGGSCSSSGPSGRAGTGTDETVRIRWNDSWGSNDTRNVYVEIRFYSGSTLDCGTWTLTVYGNTVVSSPTC